MSFSIKVGLTAAIIMIGIALLGAFVIYLSFVINDFLLFLLGYSLILLAIATVFALAFVEVTLTKKKYFDLSVLKGKKAEARTDISKGSKGIVYIEGEEWTAIALDEIKEGEYVIVEDMKGGILYVKKININ